MRKINYFKKTVIFLSLTVFLLTGSCYLGTDVETLRETVINNSVNMEMVWVPGGNFQLGKFLGTGGGSDETPVSNITLSGFYIGKFEVTQEQYQKVMGSNPSYFHGGGGREPAAGDVQGKRPVEMVNWYETLVFCNLLSIREGLTPAYRINGSTNPSDWGTVPASMNAVWNAVQIVPGSTGYRLPTGAQWEYAAKGGNGSPGSFSYSGSSNSYDVAWYGDNSGGITHEVGKKASNVLGIFDMNGNVHELCWDWFDDYTESAKIDPPGPDSGNHRTIRGGGWTYGAVTTVYRFHLDPFHKVNDVGFRVVRPGNLLTGNVSISGTAQKGNELTAVTTSLTGSGIITYQWMRDGTVIQGANSNKYTLQNSDIGSAITVIVTRSDRTGFVTSSPTADVTGVLEIKVLISGYPDDIEHFKSMLNNFVDDNPQIILDIEEVNPDQYESKVMVYAESENLPDVIYVLPSYYNATYLQQNELLVDLAPFIEKDYPISPYSQIIFNESFQSSGYLSMIPRSIVTTHVFYVNKEVLDDVGLQPAVSYSDLVSQVPILKAAGYETIIMPLKDDWVMQSCLFSMVTGRFFGANWAQSILSGNLQFLNVEFIKALEFIKQMYDDGVISRDMLDMSYEDSTEAFAANSQSAYYIDGDWRSGDFKQNNFMATVFPDIDITGVKLNNSSSAVLGPGWAMGKSNTRSSSLEDASWELIKYLTGKDVQEFELTNGHITVPVRTDININSLQLEPMQKLVAGILGKYETTTVVIDSVFASDVHGVINNVLRQIGLELMTPTDAAQAIQNAYDEWKKK